MAEKEPVVFVGHGSPMNAIGDNKYRPVWQDLGKRLGKPSALLVISAHYFTNGLRITKDTHNKQIFDMYGFPAELYQVTYEPKGDPELSKEVISLLDNEPQVDTTWGIDHGAWAVLSNMYPEADVPVVMLSVDQRRSPEELYSLGKKLIPLRDKGVMILASGNIVHHLGLVDWESDHGYPGAESFNKKVIQEVQDHKIEEILSLSKSDPTYRKAAPTPDHIDPFYVALGAAGEDYQTEAFNDSCELGSMAMTGFVFR
ncbi:MAG: dioxygenase [Bacilli bacterium]|jgi:4,5-DOPA dioxygenase extradiol|nr:dioxygenase [Bacilli bacterium]